MQQQFLPHRKRIINKNIYYFYYFYGIYVHKALPRVINIYKNSAENKLYIWDIEEAAKQFPYTKKTKAKTKKKRKHVVSSANAIPFINY